MQYAYINYKRIPYTTFYQFTQEIIDDDPQPPISGNGYEINISDNHIIDRTCYIGFNYKRDNDTDNNATVLTFDEALEILKKHIHKMYEDEIDKLNRQLSFLNHLNNGVDIVDIIECKAELSN